MKQLLEKHKPILTQIVTTIVISVLIIFVIAYNPDVKHHTVEQFTNSNLIVDNLYKENSDTYMVLRDDKNDFVVTIKNSVYYDKYIIGDNINANRYVMVHQDGTEEVIYYFTERK